MAGRTSCPVVIRSSSIAKLRTPARCSGAPCTPALHRHITSLLITVDLGRCCLVEERQALEGSRDGIRAVAISLVILLLMAGIQPHDAGADPSYAATD